MQLSKRVLIILLLVGITTVSIVGIGGVIFWGIFDSHPTVALDIFNEVFATTDTRLDTCQTCHTIGRKTNSYGSHLKSEFRSMMASSAQEITDEEGFDIFKSALRSIEVDDSDGDGHSNIDEIEARTFPGDSADYP